MNILIYGYGVVGKNFAALLSLLGFDFEILDNSKKIVVDLEKKYDVIVISNSHKEQQDKMLSYIKANAIRYEKLVFLTNTSFNPSFSSFFIEHKTEVRHAIKNGNIDDFLQQVPCLIEEKTKNIYPNILFEELNYIYIETTTYCDLRCAHCFRTGNDYEAKNKHMEFDVYKNIIDSLPFNRQFVLCPQNIGEPTLHPLFLSMLQYAKNTHKFHRIEIHSNLVSHEREYYKQLFDAGLDLLIVSIDSLNQTTLSKTRSGTNIEKLLNNLSWLLQDEMYKEKIAVRISISILNENELDMLIDFLVAMGVKTIHLAPVVDIYDANIGVDINSIERWKQYINKYSITIIVIDPCEYSGSNKCSLFEKSLNFNVLGYLVPCCVIYNHKDLNFGTIQKESLAELLEGTSYQTFKTNLYELPPKICQECLFFPKKRE
ncbi:MAG TPA: hypothetical protein CFH79_00790 [Sulfurospirillum sp. UBA11407]|nr:MAG TPA: hypothetical protein CFH79_00790 [Sulfurospirillum sp. UBA11407]